MAEIENLSISIGAHADEAFVAFDRLISKLNRTRIELKAFAAGAVVSALKDIKDNANSAASALNRFAKAQERANRAMGGFSGPGYSTTMRSAASDANAATNAIVRFVGAMAAAQSAMQRMRGANAFRNNTSFAPMQPQLTGEVDEPIITHFVDDIDDGIVHFESSTQSAKDTLDSFFRSLVSIASSPAFKEIGTGLKGIGKSLVAIPTYFGKQFIGGIKESVKGLGQFLSMIKRIATIRLIRSALKEITKGIGEGFTHLYNWSKVADHTFANSMNRIATAAQYVGNSFAAMASPLVNALSPAIDFIADKFVDLFNLINQIIARLSGATSYTAARKVSAQWQDASKSASGSAKKAADEIKRTLLGFDEINKLNDPNKSSGSGGGGSGGRGTSGSNMFETRTIDSAVSSFADQLKAAFEASDWQGLGTLLGNKVNEIVDKIDFASAGKKVGTYINGWFSTKYWTLDTINFTNIGGKIAEFLNNAIGKIDFNIIGRSVIQKMTIIGDSVIGFFTNFDWKQAATKISNFVSGLYDEIGKWFAKYDWTKVGKALGEGLANFIAGIDYVGLAKSMYTALSNALTAGIGTLTGFFDGLASKFKAAINWNALSEGVQQGISGVMAVLGLATGVIGAILAFSGANIPLGIGMMIAGGIATGTSLSLMWNGLSDKVKSNIELIKGILFGATLAVGAILAFSGANIPLGLGLMVSGAVGLAGTVSANWNVIKEKLQGPIGAVTALISGASLALGVLCMVGGNYGLGLGLILAGSAGLTSAVAANWGLMESLGQVAIKNFKNGWDSLKAGFDIIVTVIQQWASDTAQKVIMWLLNGITTIAKTVNAVLTWGSKIAESVIRWMLTGVTSITKTVNAVLTWGTKTAQNVIQWMLKGVQSIAKTVQAIINWGSKVAENVIKWMLKGVTSVSKTVNAILGWGSKIAQTVIQWMLKGITSVSKTVNAALSWASKLAKTIIEWIVNGAKEIDKTIKLGITWASDTTKKIWSWINGDASGGDKKKTISTEMVWVAGKSVDIWNWITGNKSKSASVTVNLNPGWKGTFKQALGIVSSTTLKVALKMDKKADTVELKQSGSGGGTKWTATTKALGGIFSNGVWSNIPQYAGGTANAHGSLFWAGEAGPEIVGHVGGRTEVLNKSQLASAMFSAVQAAMAPAAANFAAAASNMSAASVGVDLETLAEMVRQGVEQAMSRTNDLDRQRNEYLRQINEKDSTIEVSTSSINRAQTRMNRRAGTTIVAVGT